MKKYLNKKIFESNFKPEDYLISRLLYILAP